MDALWVFGYGSLIWDPCFPVAERRIARLDGWQRSFCMWSVRYRGTEADPGLVLALDAEPGAFCEGVAFRVTPGTEDAALAALRDRELISAAYLERRLPLEDGTPAVAFVINRDHAQYAGRLTLEDQARIIARCTGMRGPNREYLWSTAEHLSRLGIADADLEALSARVREICR